MSLLEALEEMRGYSKLKGEALDCNMRKTRAGRGCGLVRQCYGDERLRQQFFPKR